MDVTIAAGGARAATEENSLAPALFAAATVLVVLVEIVLETTSVTGVFVATIIVSVAIVSAMLVVSAPAPAPVEEVLSEP